MSPTRTRSQPEQCVGRLRDPVVDPSPYPVPHEPDVALDGLRAARGRLDDARSGLLRGRTAGWIVIALSECLHWVNPLDEEAARRSTDYRSRRNTDPDGTVVRGLLYARNFHAHSLITSMARVEQDMSADIPTLRFAWEGLERLPEPERPQPKLQRPTKRKSRAVAWVRPWTMRFAWFGREFAGGSPRGAV